MVKASDSALGPGVESPLSRRRWQKEGSSSDGKGAPGAVALLLVYARCSLLVSGILSPAGTPAEGGGLVIGGAA